MSVGLSLTTVLRSFVLLEIEPFAKDSFERLSIDRLSDDSLLRSRVTFC